MVGYELNPCLSHRVVGTSLSQNGNVLTVLSLYKHKEDEEKNGKQLEF